MLAHVAQSVTGSLPGTGAVSSFLGSVFVSDPAVSSITVPPDALFAFAEVVGPGGSASAGNGRGGGGAGNDAIISVVGNETLGVAISSATTPVATSLSRGGTVLLSANPGGAGGAGAGASGKYPGGTSVTNNKGGNGGGRLGGQGAMANGLANGAALPPGLGGGGASTSGAPGSGGPGCVNLTFFLNADAARAYANSLYGGSWQP